MSKGKVEENMQNMVTKYEFTKKFDMVAKHVSRVEFAIAALIVGVAVIAVACGYTCSRIREDIDYVRERIQETDIVQDMQENEEATTFVSEVVCADCKYEFTLMNCPLCNSAVEFLPVNKRFYIECPECKLRTDYYDSVEGLVSYWNNREISKE